MKDIKKVIWRYCLKPDTINISVYKSAERDYLEIEIIEVQLNESTKIKRIAEIIMRASPYPILLIFSINDKFQLVTGDMRKNLSDSAKVTVEDFSFTDWIDINANDEFVQKLFEELNINKLSFSNFYEMYPDAGGSCQQLVDGSEVKEIGQQSVDELESIFHIPWGHHVQILGKSKGNVEKALFYVKKTIENNWSREMLLNFMDTDLYERQGKAVTLNRPMPGSWALMWWR